MTTTYTPLNRYILVSRGAQQQPTQPEDDGEFKVLLPEGYKSPESTYEQVQVLDVAPNCAFLDRVETGTTLIVLSQMIEEIVIGDTTHTVILENHVMGIVETEE